MCFFLLRDCWCYCSIPSEKYRIHQRWILSFGSSHRCLLKYLSFFSNIIPYCLIFVFQLSYFILSQIFNTCNRRRSSHNPFFRLRNTRRSRPSSQLHANVCIWVVHATIASTINTNTFRLPILSLFFPFLSSYWCFSLKVFQVKLFTILSVDVITLYFFHKIIFFLLKLCLSLWLSYSFLLFSD